MLAYAENIGIRLLDWQALNDLPIEELLSDEIKKKVSLEDYEEKLKEYCHAILDPDESKLKDFPISINAPTPYEWISSWERRVWLTLPSNPLPIYSLFCMNKEWCWFVLVWFYCHRQDLLDCANKCLPRLSAFGIDGWEFHFKWVSFGKDDGMRYLLVFGPNYQLGKSAEPRDFSNREGKRIIDSFRYFYKHACQRSRSGLSDTLVDATHVAVTPSTS
jgi:hypothetical protein